MHSPRSAAAMPRSPLLGFITQRTRPRRSTPRRLAGTYHRCLGFHIGALPHLSRNLNGVGRGLCGVLCGHDNCALNIGPNDCFDLSHSLSRGCCAARCACAGACARAFTLYETRHPCWRGQVARHALYFLTRRARVRVRGRSVPTYTARPLPACPRHCHFLSPATPR